MATDSRAVPFTSATRALAVVQRAVDDTIAQTPGMPLQWWRLQAKVWAPESHLALLRSILPSDAEPQARTDGSLSIEQELILIEDDALARTLIEFTVAPVGVDGLQCLTGWLCGRPIGWVRAAAWPDRLVILRLRHHRWVAVVAPGDRAPRAAEVLLKQVVETDLVGCGAMPLHGSAALPSGRDDSMMFLGSAGAGKTTSALTVAAAGGRLLAGDRVSALGPRASTRDRAVLVGSAQSTRLRWGTIRGLGLETAVCGADLQRHGLDHATIRPGSPEKVVLGHGEIARLGIPTVSSADLGAIVLLERREDSEGPTLTPCRDQRYELVRPHLRRSWLALPATASRSAHDVPAILGRARWFHLRWQPERDDLLGLLQGVLR